MWQAPNQRLRAVANAKRKERERARRPIHIKRISAKVGLVSGENTEYLPAEFRLTLNDLSPAGVGVYSTSPLAAGQLVVLEINDPIAIKIRAKVIWCQGHTSRGHIISNQSFSFRMGFEFVLSTPEETVAVQNFCENISKNHIFSLRSA